MGCITPRILSYVTYLWCPEGCQGQPGAQDAEVYRTLLTPGLRLSAWCWHLSRESCLTWPGLSPCWGLPVLCLLLHSCTMALFLHVSESFIHVCPSHQLGGHMHLGTLPALHCIHHIGELLSAHWILNKHLRAKRRNQVV